MQHLVAFVFLLVATFVLAPLVASAEDDRVFELRTYRTNDGKLDDLLARFRDHTCALFEKHGMQNIGYWVPIHEEDGAENTLIYVIAHESRDAAKKSWKGFILDPDWHAARDASEVNGRLLAEKPESVFMKATDYSPAIKTGVAEPERTFLLRTYQAAEGKLDALHARFREHTVDLFSKHGMSHVGYWDPTDPEDGAGSKLIYILSLPSEEAGEQSFASFRKDPEWQKARAESEKDGGLTVKGGVQGIYLKPTDFSSLR
jgi:hypothetical protein